VHLPTWSSCDVERWCIPPPISCILPLLMAPITAGNTALSPLPQIIGGGGERVHIDDSQGVDFTFETAFFCLGYFHKTPFRVNK